MEQRSVSDIVKELEPFLKDYEKDQGLRIIDAVEEPGSKIGDNYMSIVIRTKVTGIRGNGDLYSSSFMTKRFPRHRKIVDVIRNADLFFNEAHVYTKLLPRFGSVAPRCVHANSDDIIMEDLRARGYVVCERRNLLDLQHCKATVKALAVLHARSLMLKLNSPEEFEALTNPLLEAAFPRDESPSLGISVDTSFSSAIKNLAAIPNLDEEMLRALDFLKGHEHCGFKFIRDLFARRKEKYHVLTHGDAWNNNIVFKHDENDRIVDVKLIDYQIVRHSSPAIDFHYFVYSSARASVISENYDDLVKTYHEALIAELRDLGADAKTLRDVSVEWFYSELKSMSMYGLYMSLWLVNAVLADDEDAVDMDALGTDFMEALKKPEVPIKAPKLERIKFIILHYCRTYVWSD